jgi:L-seryl-tRNA(Ser) seleniumtransferase
MAVMDTQERLRRLPQVDEVLTRDEVAGLLAAHPRSLVVGAVRDAIEEARSALLADPASEFTSDLLLASVSQRLVARASRSPRSVVNATGIIVHTNLGRSILAEEAVEAVRDVARGYSTLEYDAERGERGSRHDHVEWLLTELTGAEAAMAVNNNAAAVLLGIAVLAAGREAIVSRGELVEIGGSFRIPEIMAASGARMVEVGTTNKTHPSDYEDAAGPETGLLLKVHSSNFRMVGFTDQVPLAQLVSIGRARGLPVFEDQGSGALVDLAAFGLAGEPTIAASVEVGADLVSASGDKLLGGPQAGILVGTGEVIERLRAHPLARALRLDKMTIAALVATLRLYLDPDEAVRRIPTLAMLAAPESEMESRARALAERIRGECEEAFDVAVAADVSRAGGGALPAVDIPTHVVALVPRAGGVVELERALRLGSPPIVARVKDDKVLVDPRTLTDDDEKVLVEALAGLAAG